MTQSLIILFTFLHILQEAIFFFLKWLLPECILTQSVDPILLGICFHWLFSMIVVLSSKQPYTQTFEDIFDHFFRKKFIDGIRGSKAVYNLKISYTYRLPDGLNRWNFCRSDVGQQRVRSSWGQHLSWARLIVLYHFGCWEYFHQSKATRETAYFTICCSSQRDPLLLRG